MNIEESTDILKNIIADEVIGTYCIEIQKEGINCSENCKDEDCYLIQAIETVLNELDNKDKIIKELKEKIEYLEKENKVVRIFKESMPKDTEIVVITKENYEKNFKEED